MTTATLTTKGQVVIPKDVRNALHLQAGDLLDFVLKENNEVVMRPAKEDVRDLKGILHVKTGKSVSLERMQEVIRDHGRSLR